MAVVNFMKYGSVRRLNQQIGHQRMLTHWLYVGRANPRKGLSKSVLANPWSSKSRSSAIRVPTKEIAIANYKRWLWKHIQAGNEEVINELKKIDSKTAVVCWCSPEPCHGEVVEAAARWLKTEDGKKLLKESNL